MAKINLSPPKFSSHEKNRKVHFKIYDVGDNFSIYIWSKNYHISGFQFYLLNADIKMTGNGYGGICQEYGFNTIISKQGIIYGMAYKSNSKVLPMHSTVDTSDGSSSNFQLLTNIFCPFASNPYIPIPGRVWFKIYSLPSKIPLVFDKLNFIFS